MIRTIVDCTDDTTRALVQALADRRTKPQARTAPPPHVKDLRGRQFDRLTVQAFLYIRGGHTYWRCRCACGATKVTTGSNLQRGRAKSCGCSRRTVQDVTFERARETARLHRRGMTPREIAAHLHCSLRTVFMHLAIMRRQEESRHG